MWKLNFFLLISLTSCVCAENIVFPDDFKFGVATASYQIEGAWNISDKSENVWDHFTHFESHKIKDRSTGDVACDSYHNLERDIEMLKELKVDFYRFSIAWTRLVPDPFSSRVSEDGLRYYNNLIDELIKNNITPVVTMFHWDTPWSYQKMGGWTNDIIVDAFADYARICFEHFGDRVKTWLTFNEAYNMCLYGYGTKDAFLTFAPDLDLHGFGEYACAHNVLKAHAKAYHIYQDSFRARQGGKISMAFVVLWAEPESDSEEDKLIALKSMEFNMGWLAHPIFLGDYPQVMRDEVDNMSKLQGFNQSRLPQFTREDVDFIRGTADFIGVNYYTAVVFRNTKERASRQVPSQENDIGYEFYQPEHWPSGASEWLKLRPTGLRDMLNWVYQTYNRSEIIICENGFSSRGGLKDLDRVDAFNTHLEQVALSIQDGVNVTGFTAWSLMDNFEWVNGYTERFGLYQVDFMDPKRKRTPRLSVYVYKRIVETHVVDYDYIPDIPGLEDDDIPKEEAIPFHVVIIGSIAVLGVVIIVISLFIHKKRKAWKKDLRF